MKADSKSEWIIYMLSGVTRNGHTLNEVLAYDDTRFDVEHGFIQWVLPNIEPSNVNLDAPILLDQDIDFYHESEMLRQACGRVNARFLKSLGILRVDISQQSFNNTESISGGLIKSLNFENLSRHWLCAHSHQHLRITRFIHFNMAMGNHALCKELLEFISNEIKSITCPPIISLKYWESAIARK
jgi:hypothetical protein